MNKHGAHILIVDDEREIIRALSRSLKAFGFTTFTASTGEEALKAIHQHCFDLVLLDLLLPGISGQEVCRQIRTFSTLPIIVLSAKETEQDKIEILDLGADDYIQKPFGINEVLARIRVALRRMAQISSGSEPSVQIGTLQVDFARRQVQIKGQEIALTPTEYNLLKVLVTNRGKILTRQMLLQAVWGTEVETRVHSLHMYVGHLRQKIEADPLHPRFILTVPGVGYRFNEEFAT